MQRWIAAAAVVMFLLLGGAWYAYRSYHANRPHPVWVPLQIRADLDRSERDKLIQKLKTELSETVVMIKISSDLGLTKKWGLPSDEACAQELNRRLFVRAGDADSPMGKVPAILIGVEGKEKESSVSEAISLRLMEDVARILGMKLPPRSAK
jgi:hypothetical protein